MEIECTHEWCWYKTEVRPKIPLDQPLEEVKKCKDAKRIVLYYCANCFALTMTEYPLIE